MNAGDTTFRQTLDQTAMPMDARLSDQWMTFPLKELQVTQQHRSIVANLVGNPQLRTKLADQMKEIGNLQHLMGRVAMGCITPREVVRLGLSTALIAPTR